MRNIKLIITLLFSFLILTSTTAYTANMGKNYRSPSSYSKTQAQSKLFSITPIMGVDYTSINYLQLTPADQSRIENRVDVEFTNHSKALNYGVMLDAMFRVSQADSYYAGIELGFLHQPKTKVGEMLIKEYQFDEAHPEVPAIKTSAGKLYIKNSVIPLLFTFSDLCDQNKFLLTTKLGVSFVNGKYYVNSGEYQLMQGAKSDFMMILTFGIDGRYYFTDHFAGYIGILGSAGGIGTSGIAAVGGVSGQNAIDLKGLWHILAGVTYTI